MHSMIERGLDGMHSIQSSLNLCGLDGMHSIQSSLNLCTGRPPIGVMIPETV